MYNFTNDKRYKKVKIQTKLDKLLNILPVNLKSGVEFFYTKNNILFFVLNHQMYKNEFKHNSMLILSLLREIGFENIKDIKYFVTNKPKIKKFKPKMVEYPQYKRVSYGIFDNLASNRLVFEKFEQIRDLIKEKI